MASIHPNKRVHTERHQDTFLSALLDKSSFLALDFKELLFLLWNIVSSQRKKAEEKQNDNSTHTLTIPEADRHFSHLRSYYKHHKTNLLFTFKSNMMVYLTLHYIGRKFHFCSFFFEDDYCNMTVVTKDLLTSFLQQR